MSYPGEAAEQQRKQDRLHNAYMSQSFSVFISHSGRQKQSFADSLLRKLQLNGINAFLDQRSLRQGVAAAQMMQDAVRHADVVIVVLTLNYLQSASCMEELRWALDEQQQRHENGLRKLTILTELYWSNDQTIGIPVDTLPAEGTPWGALSARLRAALENQEELLVPLEQQLKDLAALKRFTCKGTNDGLKCAPGLITSVLCLSVHGKWRSHVSRVSLPSLKNWTAISKEVDCVHLMLLCNLVVLLMVQV